MTDRVTTAPYTSFLNQTLEGDSRLWTWLVGIWFAITVWFYGQVILSLPMTGAAIISEPGGIEAFMQNMPQHMKRVATYGTMNEHQYSQTLTLIWNDEPTVTERIYIFRSDYKGHVTVAYDHVWRDDTIASGM